jgi:hypothetical protein
MSDGLTFERRDVQIRELFGDGADGLGIHIGHLMDEMIVIERAEIVGCFVL